MNKIYCQLLISGAICCISFSTSAFCQQNTPQHDTLTDSINRKVTIENTGDSMVVTAKRMNRDKEIQKHTSVSFSSKEIKTTAGSANDVSRYLGTIPSIVSGISQKFDNTLYIRGGRATEVQFLVDGIEFENINHFSVDNGSGGPLGFINADFIRAVRFYADDMPASYPDRLSSIVDIDMKAGSLLQTKTSIGMRDVGPQASIEGPLPHNAGSFILALRYIDFAMLKNFLGDAGIPALGDAYGKLLFLLNDKMFLSISGIAAYNTYHYGYQVTLNGNESPVASVHENYQTMKQRFVQGGTGILLHYKDDIFEHQLHISFSARNSINYDSLSNYADTFTTHRYVKNPIEESMDNRSHVALNYKSNIAIANNQSVSAGARAYETSYDFKTANETQDTGICPYCDQDTPKTYISHTMPYEKSVHIDGLELGLFADYNYATGPLHTSFGIRADYYTLLGDMAFSPRISSVLSFGDFGNFLAGFGIYHQFPTDLPTIIFTNTNSLPPDSLKNMELTYLNKAQPERCYQASAGYDIVLWDRVQTKLALYYKLYDHEYHYLLPNGNPYLVPYQPDFSYICSGQQDGRRRSFGCEWSANNINKTWYFYSLGLSVFDVKTQFDNNNWYNDWTNVEYTGSLSLGATVMHDHTFSLSAQGSGGRPYCQCVIYTDCLNRQLDSLLSTQPYYTKRLAYLLTVNGRYSYTKKINGVELEAFLEVINMLNYKPALDYQFNGVGFVAIRPFGITPILGLDLHF